MKYDLVLTGKFKKGLKLAKKRGLNIELLEEVVDKLVRKANARGGKDNISVAYLKKESGDL